MEPTSIQLPLLLVTTLITLFIGFVLSKVKAYFGGTYCQADRNLQGQVILITGGNSGIGR